MAAATSSFDLEQIRARVAGFSARRAPDLGRPAGVLVPLLPRPDGLHLLFTERSAGLRAHAGQISFPGGSRDASDASMQAAALREAHEEVGLDPAHAEVIGELDDVPTFVTGFVITPIVAIVDAGQLDREGRYPWQASAGEVVQLLELPLSGFFDKSALRIEERERDGVRFELYWYTVQGATVWGATARIVHQLTQVIAGQPVGPPPWHDAKATLRSIS